MRKISFEIPTGIKAGKRALAAVIFSSLASCSYAQRKLPDVTVADLSGNSLSTATLLQAGLPVVLSFWSTICKPCLEELNAYRDNYAVWNAEMPFKLVAVSVDDNRFSSKAKAFAAAGKWPATVLLDQNQSFKRALNVNAIPQLFLFDKNGKLVYTHTGYTSGSELELYEALENLYGKPGK